MKQVLAQETLVVLEQGSPGTRYLYYALQDNGSTSLVGALNFDQEGLLG